MAPKATPASDFMSRVSTIYRVYFLWFEHVATLVGTYFCFLDPERFISVTVPVPAHAADDDAEPRMPLRPVRYQ
jgi:hypothetical protein